MRIAVDAMGGDSPAMVVQGALQAAIEWGMDITFVGQREVINTLIQEQKEQIAFHIEHCPEMIAMDEAPVKAIRKKKKASIRVAFELVKRGEADAVVSAGNSGATLAAGVLVLGKMKRIERPAFAGIFPGEKGEVVIIDVGANVDCRAEHLFHFGLMAEAFATTCLNMIQPKVGLLNIGQEGGKGNEQVRMAHDLFKSSSLNFIGNVEGRDIFSGEVPIIVCDGFVGNVALKLSEGIMEVLIGIIKHTLTGLTEEQMAIHKHAGGFWEIIRKMDYAEYGGAPVLGINGVGIVCHGSSSARAVKNAVKMADHYAGQHMPERLAQYFESIQNQLPKSEN
jgi:glycerol-3-phosphate acyltransferase PlsX